MRTVNIARVAIVGACALVALPAIVFAAPQQQQSAAEAAKKAKEQQKTAPKAQTVWTNDTIGTVQGTINVVGQSNAPPAAAKAPAEGKTGAAAAAAPAASPEELAKLMSELADAKKALESVKADLDIAQRKYDLDAAQYYGTPNYAANKQGQAMLDGEKSAIAEKKQDADAAQKKVDDLEKQIKALGGKVESPQPKPAAPQS